MFFDTAIEKKLCHDIACSFFHLWRLVDAVLAKQTIALAFSSQFNNLFRFIWLNLCIGMIFACPGSDLYMRIPIGAVRPKGHYRCYLRIISEPKLSQIPDQSNRFAIFVAAADIESRNAIFRFWLCELFEEKMTIWNIYDSSAKLVWFRTSRDRIFRISPTAEGTLEIQTEYILCPEQLILPHSSYISHSRRNVKEIKGVGWIQIDTFNPIENWLIEFSDSPWMRFLSGAVDWLTTQMKSEFLLYKHDNSLFRAFSSITY